MAKVIVSKFCHWMAFPSVLWQNPGRLQKITSMGFVMEWLLPYNKDGFSQLYIAFLSEMKHQMHCKRLWCALALCPSKFLVGILSGPSQHILAFCPNYGIHFYHHPPTLFRAKSQLSLPNFLPFPLGLHQFPPTFPYTPPLQPLPGRGIQWGSCHGCNLWEGPSHTVVKWLLMVTAHHDPS